MRRSHHRSSRPRPAALYQVEGRFLRDSFAVMNNLQRLAGGEPVLAACYSASKGSPDMVDFVLLMQARRGS